MADLKQIIQELNAEISAENPTVSRVLEDGSRVVSYGDGRFAYYKPGENKYTLYDAAGNLQGFESQRDVRGGVEYTTFNPEGQQIDKFVASNTPGVAGILAPIALTAMGGYALGPAASGLLSTPAAAAASTGGMTLFQGGSVEDALKNAALAGLTAYGVQGLMGGGETAGAQQALELSLADDISQLAQQGLSQNQIANIISQGYGVDPFTAAEAVTSALSSVAPTTAAQTVNVAGTGLLNPAIAPTALSSLATMAGATPGQSVTVQGQNLPQTQVTTQDLLTALTPAITGTLPAVTGGTQTVEVPGSKTTTTENIISSIVPALTTAVIPGTTPAVTQPTGTQQVQITAPKDTSVLPAIVPPVIAAIPTLPAGITAELPKPTQPPDKKSVFTPSDILNIIGILGGVGATTALSNTGTGTVSTPPSDTMIGSTTPQFGPDYYAAVQRYYNAYMPETPRNVATPLQQWYENKFGA
jgi:hypothetical protein